MHSRPHDIAINNLTSLYLIPTASGRKIIIKQFGARGGCFQPNLIMAITNDILIELIKDKVSSYIKKKRHINAVEKLTNFVTII